jgi:hypothetical protein
MRFGWIVVLAVVVGRGRMCLAEDAKAAAPAAPAAPAARFEISKETTFVTGPVRADGTIDYVEAINEHLSKGVTKENNAAIPVLEAVQSLGVGQDAHYARVWAKLGVAAPAGAAQGAVAPAPPGNPANFDDTLSGPWIVEKAPQVAAWLDSMKGQLDLLVEASKRDHYYMPLVREQPTDPLVMVLLPHLQHMRHMANSLKSRAMLRLGNDDTDGFCADVIAIVRLGRLSTHAPTLVENLVGIAMEAIGLDAIKTAASGKWLSEAQVGKLLAELRAAPAPRAMYDIMDGGERGFLLEFLQTAAVHGVAEAQKMFAALGQRNNITLPPIDPAGKDWNAALKSANAWYDRLAEAGRKPTYAERMAASKAINQDVATLKVKYDGWKAVFAPLEDRIIVLVLPAMERAFTTETRIAADRELTQAALALSGFRSKMREYPPGLKLLVPGYFKSEPVDLFTSKPLVYRTEGNGYVLLSVGPDGKEGGVKADDLVVRVGK